VSSEDLADTTRIRVRHLHARLKTKFAEASAEFPPMKQRKQSRRSIGGVFQAVAIGAPHALDDIDAAYEGDPAATTYEEIILAYPRWRRSPFIEWRICSTEKCR
jgi:hypothetical protein